MEGFVSLSPHRQQLVAFILYAWCESARDGKKSKTKASSQMDPLSFGRVDFESAYSDL